MPNSDLGKFAEGFASWRRMMATVPEDARIKVFVNLANDAADCVSRGLDKAVAVDELYDIASAYGVVEAQGMDGVQTTIADAFMRPPTNGRSKEEARTPIPFLSKQNFIGAFRPPDYLVDGILQHGFVYAMTGATGHAKTAIALLIAELVSSADRNAVLGLHKVNKGKVVYFAGENPDDLRMRVIGANAKRTDDPTLDRIWFIPGAFNINEMYAMLTLRITAIGGVDMIIVDTSAAYFLGQDENANQQIGAHARMLRRLTELPGTPCVLVLCHPIKHAQEPAQLLPRGGGAFLAEMDGNLTVWKDDTVITLHHNKIRGPEFEALMFALDKIQTPQLVDSEGRMIPTVRAIPISQSDEIKQKDKARDDEDRVLVALLGNPDASMADIADRWDWTFGSGAPAKSRVQRAINRIDENAHPKLLRNNRDKWELTEEGKTVARKASLVFRAQEESASQQTMKLQ